MRSVVYRKCMGRITILLVASKTYVCAFCVARTALYLMNLSSIHVYHKRSRALPPGQVVVSFTSFTVCLLRFSPRIKSENSAGKQLQCSSASWMRARDFSKVSSLQSYHWTKIKAQKQQVLESEINCPYLMDFPLIILYHYRLEHVLESA